MKKKNILVYDETTGKWVSQNVEMSAEEVAEAKAEAELQRIADAKAEAEAFEASLISDELGNKYQQKIVDGQYTLVCVENADGTMNL